MKTGSNQRTNEPSQQKREREKKLFVWFIIQVLWKLQTCKRHLKFFFFFSLCMHLWCMRCMYAYMWIRKMLSVVLFYQWLNFEFVMFKGLKFHLCECKCFFSLFFFFLVLHCTMLPEYFLGHVTQESSIEQFWAE